MIPVSSKVKPVLQKIFDFGIWLDLKTFIIFWLDLHGTLMNEKKNQEVGLYFRKWLVVRL